MADSHDLFGERSIRRAKQLDAFCDEFEKQCLEGSRPSIESYLMRVEEPDKQPLLIELIAIEMHYRRRQGESISISEYQERFPGLSVSGFDETIQLSAHKLLQADGQAACAGNVPTVASRGSGAIEVESKFVKYFGDYELLHIIARGGMGIVYKARQVSLDRTVALKMILSGDFASKEEVERFYSEAKAAALLDHPGIVPIFEVGEHEGKHFFSMAFVEGSSLAARLSDGPLEPIAAAQKLLEVAQAVQYAHEQGVIHRDLKPANILLDLHDRPRVTDFGLAKRLTDNSGMTVSGQVLGTPSYMPPEQAAGQVNAIGPGSDVYALGAILYSLTTGRPPFQAASSLDTLRQVIYQEPVPPRQLNSGIPRDLETIILKCLDKSLPRRYDSAQQLADELQRFIEGRPIIARPISRAAKAWRWCRRNRAVASLATFISLLLAGLAGGACWAYWRESAFSHDLQYSLEQQTEARLETRRNLYVSDAARVDELLKESNFVRAKTLLERHIPTSLDEEDLRGFDWYYQWRKLSQQKARYDFKKPVEVIALSADDRTLAVGCEGGRAYLLDVESGKLRDATFSIDDEHWSSIAFLDSNRLVGNGQQGSFKLWDQSTYVTLASKPSWYAIDHQKSGTTFEDRIPASVSADSRRMICSDFMNNLAIWDLTNLRPKPIPYVNHGNHTYKVQGETFIRLFEANTYKWFSGGENGPLQNLITDTNSRDLDDLMIREFAEKASREYSSAGTSKVGLSGLDGKFAKERGMIGHRITAVSLSNQANTMLTGDVLGNVQLWNTAALEDPSRWSEAIPRTLSLGKLPIRSAAMSKNSKMFAVCDEKHCWVYGTSELEPLLKIDASECNYTSTRFVGNDSLAIGTSTGLVDVLRISDWKRTNRFFVGQGEIREILTDRAQKSLHVASSDGSVVRVELEQDLLPLVPQRTAWLNPRVPNSLAWLPLSKQIVFHRDESEEFVLFDPISPEHHYALDLKIPGNPRAMPGISELPVFFRERKAGTELISIDAREIKVWNRESNTLDKKLSTLQHVAENGRPFPIMANQHPIKWLRFNDEAFNEPNLFPNSDAGMQTVFNSADLFSDERRLVMALGAGPLQLVIRDIDSGKILSELRIMGATRIAGSTSVTCLDEQRVFVDGISLFDDKKRIVVDGFSIFDEKTRRNAGLVWNTADNSLTVIESSLNSSTTTLDSNTSNPNDLTSVVGSYVINRAKDLKEVAIWDRTSIRIFDSNSLALVVAARAPEKGNIHFAYLDITGDLYAVLQESREFRWSKWSRDSNEWETVFKCRCVDSVFDSRRELRWCFDSSQSVLYRMVELGSFQRWDAADGTELPPLVIPYGSVERFQIDKSGIAIALQNTKVVTDAWTNNWSVAWFKDGLRIRSPFVNVTRIGPNFFCLPLPKPGYWLTETGIHVSRQKETTSQLGEVLSELVFEKAEKGDRELVRFEGKEPEHDSNNLNSQVLMSADSSCLVQVVSEMLHFWLLDAKSDERSACIYRYAGASQLAQADVSKVCLSSNGTKIGALIGNELKWAKQPFEDWSNIQVNAPSDAKVASIRWSWDNKTLAVGLSNGDAVLHNAESGFSRTLSRGHTGAVYDLLWLPDRRTLATAGNDGFVVFWDLSQLEIRLRIAAHRSAVKTLAFDPASSTLYSGGEDGLIQRWVATGSDVDQSNLPNQFEAPDPDAQVHESIVAPSAALVQNREVVQWLKTLNVEYSLASYGMLLSESSHDDELDGLSVHTISFRAYPDLTDNDLIYLTGLTELRSLDLAKCKLTAAGLSHHLKQLNGLHTLDLSGIDLSGFDFGSLKDSSNLQTLKLNQCFLTDSQLLSIIRLFPQMRVLEINKSLLTDGSVSKIDSLKYLRTLALSSSGVSDESLPAIKSLEKLEQLDLSSSKISGENLLQLRSLKLVKELRIKGTAVNDKWLKDLTEPHFLDSVAGSYYWKHLKLLDVRDTEITSDGIIAFLSYGNLTDIYVSDHVFGEHPEFEALLNLGPLRKSQWGTLHVDGKRLNTLDAIKALMSGGSITGLIWPIDTQHSIEDIVTLSRLPRLERILISDDAIPKIHFPVLSQIAGLRELDFPSRSYSANEFQFIGEIPQLRKLDLGILNDEGVLAHVKKLKNLESLTFVGAAGIDVLAFDNPPLKVLSCSKIEAKEQGAVAPLVDSLETLWYRASPNKELGSILAKLKNLKQLILPGYVTAQELEKLQAELPDVKVRISNESP